MSNLTSTTNAFSVTEKVQYALKTALFRTMQTAFGDSGASEKAAPPRIFPKDIMQTNLVEIGKGDIDEDGYFASRAMGSGYAHNGNNNKVNLEAAELIIAKYRIIDPSTNMITTLRVETLAGDYSNKNQSTINGYDAAGSSSQTYPKQNWFFRGHYGSRSGTTAFNAANANYDGLQLAWDKATPNTVAAEADIVPHLKYYLQVQTTYTTVSDGSSPDNITYIHDKMKGLIGLDQNFTTTIAVNTGEGHNCGSLNTSGTAAGEYWFTQATSGTLAFYGVGTSGQGSGFVSTNKGLNNLSTTEFPMISYVRYVGETGFGASSGGSGGGSGSLYDFSSHIFTRCGATGRYGPSLSDCTTEYSSTTWASNTAYFNQTIAGMQDWTVPQTGTYTITAVGAAGGDGGYGDGNGVGYSGSAGAIITRDFDLIGGEVIRILVGQEGKGEPTYYHKPGPGGGGTFITRAPHNTLESIIIIAGGGAGGGQGTWGQSDLGLHESSSSVGGADNGITSSSNGYSDGAGGKGPSNNNYGGNGGGFWGDGHSTGSGEGSTAGHSYVNSSEPGHGGKGMTHATLCEGGFGGGGAGNLLPGAGGGFAGGKYEGFWASAGKAYGGSSYVQGEGPLYKHNDSSIVDNRPHTYKHPYNANPTVPFDYPRHGYVTIVKKLSLGIMNGETDPAYLLDVEGDVGLGMIVDPRDHFDFGFGYNAGTATNNGDGTRTMTRGGGDSVYDITNATPVGGWVDGVRYKITIEAKISSGTGNLEWRSGWTTYWTGGLTDEFQTWVFYRVGNWGPNYFKSYISDVTFKQFKIETRCFNIADGNVGIGTTSPYSKLSISAPSSADVNAGKGTLAVAETSAGYYFYGLGLASAGTEATAGLGIWGGTEGSTASNSNCHLFIKRSSGNVGVGRTNPSYKLDVNGTLATNNGLYHSNYQYYISDTNTRRYWDSNNIYWSCSPSWEMALYNGNLGIGETGPTSKLTLKGGGMFLKQSTHYQNTRPAAPSNGTTVQDYEIASYGAGSYPNDMGFLRLRAGNNGNNTRIDLSAYTPGGTEECHKNIVFYTSNTERMRIDINEVKFSEPIKCLDNIRMGGNTKILRESEERDHIQFHTDNSIRFTTHQASYGETCKMVVGNGRSFGGVGINMTSAKAELHVHCTATYCYFMVTNPWSGTAINDGFTVCTKVNDCDMHWKGNDGKKAMISFFEGNLRFKNQVQNGDITHMQLTDGNLGIGMGTNTPGCRLSVAWSDNTATDYLGFYRSNTTKYGALGYDSSFYIFAIENIPIRWGINNSEKMRLDTNGRLGIGESSPKCRLDVGNGKICFHGGTFGGTCGLSYYYGTQSTERPVILFDTGGSTVIRSTDNNASDGIRFQIYGGSEKMFIKNNGYVGIGRDPSYHIDVNGNARFSGYQLIENGDSSYLRFGPNSSWGNYLFVGSGPRFATANACVFNTTGNLHLDSANDSTLYLQHYSYRPVHMNRDYPTIFYNEGCQISIQGANDGGSSRGLYFWRVNDVSWGMYMRSDGGNAMDGGASGSDLLGGDGWRICTRISDDAKHAFHWENSNEDRLFAVRASDGTARTNYQFWAGVGNGKGWCRWAAWGGVHHDSDAGAGSWLLIRGEQGQLPGHTNSWYMVHKTHYTNMYFSANGYYSGYISGYPYGRHMNNFTGQHRPLPSDEFKNVLENLDDYIGLIVSATNEINSLVMDPVTRIYKQTAGHKGILVNEALPKVVLSTKYKDKACYGIVAGGEDELNFEDNARATTNKNEKHYQNGMFTSILICEEEDNRLFINSVGEGGIWVCDEQGPIENGDYITTSGTLHGYGVAQEDDLMHNYTVAKATIDCDFTISYKGMKKKCREKHGTYVPYEEVQGEVKQVNTIPSDEYKCYHCTTDSILSEKEQKEDGKDEGEKYRWAEKCKCDHNSHYTSNSGWCRNEAGLICDISYCCTGVNDCSENMVDKICECDISGECQKLVDDESLPHIQCGVPVYKKDWCTDSYDASGNLKMCWNQDAVATDESGNIVYEEKCMCCGKYGWRCTCDDGYGCDKDDCTSYSCCVRDCCYEPDYDENALYKCREIEKDGKTYRIAFIACTYHCG